MNSPLAGEVALVTGSGRGLGRAIADVLAQRGAAVAVHDIHDTAPSEFAEASSLSAVADQLRAHGGLVAAVSGDVTDEAAVACIVDEAETQLGAISVLVHCAGGDISVRGGKPSPNDCLDIPTDELSPMINRNLLSTMHVTRHVGRRMRDRQRGSIICIASVAAHTGVAEGAVYAVAKAGVVHWVRCLSQQLQPFGVRVNAVSPGPTLTARFEATRHVDVSMKGEGSPSLNRLGRPGDIAGAVAFLAGPDAGWISGQVLRVDGARQLTPA